MIMFRICCALLLLLSPARAFVVRHSTNPGTALAAQSRKEREETEVFRRRLERSFRTTYVPTPQPCVSSTDIHRRKLEIRMLESLKTSDQAVDELVHFWTCQGDTESAKLILKMQSGVSTNLRQEEQQLRRMMQQHPTWAEPVVLLATLMHAVGNIREAIDLVRHALHIKPWHFEARQLHVVLLLKAHQKAHAVYAARMSMPPLRRRPDAKRNGAKRKEWVEWALYWANKDLKEAERLYAVAIGTPSFANHTGFE